MRVVRLEEFKGGWIVGNFDPTLWKQDGVEVAIKHYKPGDVDKAHGHSVATEITVIVYGKVIMRGRTPGQDVILSTGDAIVLYPGEPMPGDWEVLQSTSTCCIKYPSVPGDKFPVSV